MKGIQIKINGAWIYLEDDFSISLEQTNPLFNDQGTFSFPFEIPLEPNRKIFKNIADPFGDIGLKDIDRMPAEVWVNGVLLYRGKIETDSEIEFEGSVPVTFISGNSDFMDRIQDLGARDIPLDRDIKIGYLVAEAENEQYGRKIKLPDYVMMNFTEYNVSDPYPAKTYCNVRVCTSNTDGYYKVLDAKRPYSGVCFYVMYLIDCLFKHLKITVKRNDLDTMEDMTRLAFFTTQCHATQSEESRTVTVADISQKDFCGPNFQLKYWMKSSRPGWDDIELDTNDFIYHAYDLYATNENYPDVTIEEVMEDLKNAFGVRFLFDSYSEEISIVYIKDILSQQGSETLSVEILGYKLERQKSEGMRITYGEDDDETFNYTDYSQVNEYDSYQAVLQAGISSFDKYCKIDKSTGNAYRVKVNKETGGNPSLFEVGGFRDYTYPSDSSDPEEVSLNFKPVIVNSVSAELAADGGTTQNNTSSADRVDNTSSTRSSTRPSSGTGSSSGRPGNANPLDSKSRLEAIFADVELDNGTEINRNIAEGYTYYTRDDEAQNTDAYLMSYIYIRALCPELFDTESNDEPPLRNYDAGYTLGIMRGPGSESSLEVVEANYDGEGNDTWVQTVGSYSFSSDSCDSFGRFYDYNGTEQGGIDQSGRISLKIVAEKDGYPIGDQYAGRGLASKFLSEYIYFVCNRKTVIITARLSITQIIGIDFLKKYKIGNYVGFINKISYTVTTEGVSEVTIELYSI